MNKQRGRAGRWGIVALGVLALALSALYVYGKQMYSESRAVLAFVDALEAEDAARTAAWLKPIGGDRAISEAEAAKLLDYLAENGLADQAITDVQLGYEGYMPDNRLFAVVKDGKHYGLYDRYRMAVMTAKVRVSTNFKDAVIQLEGQTVATADSDDYNVELGPLIPGSYKLEASYDGTYAHMRTEQSIEVGRAGGTITADLSLNGGMVQVDANYAGARLFIDGKDTGVSTGQETRLGPVAMDGSNRLHAELAFPWGMAKSAPMPIDREAVKVQIDPNTDELKEMVMQTVASFLQSWTEAGNEQDASLLAHMSPERREQLAASIDEYKAQGMRSETREKELMFDLDSIYVQQDGDGSYRTAASLKRTYESRYYADGETPPPFDAFTDTMTYRLTLQEGEWIVTDWYEELHYDPVHEKEWRFVS